MSRLSNLRDVLSRARPAAFLLAAALVAAGCGDDDDDRGDLNVEGGTVLLSHSDARRRREGCTARLPPRLTHPRLYGNLNGAVNTR